MDSAIVVNDLVKDYQSGTRALDGCSLEVQKGEVFGLVGTNGAGKTTLIRIITTMLLPTSGTVKVMGIDPIKEPETVRSLIGSLPQEAGMYEEFTVL